LWPFAVLGWPDNLETQFYPTSVLITGRDILNLWVSRMILTSLDFVDDIPFHDVFVHPTVQDCFGLRMSKSLGTGIDPMELIETYGADATRFGLLQLATGAQDVRFIDNAEVQLGETEVRRRLKNKKPLDLSWDGKPGERFPQMQSARGFANKIWNAARFVLSASTVEIDRTVVPQPDDLASRWILARLDATTEIVTNKLEAYDFEGAASALYTFVWGDFCDWFVELSKPHLRAGDANRITLLTHVLDVSLRLLHPFMPYLSEEIWQRLPIERDTESICIAAWPQSSGVEHGAAEREFALVQDAVRAARNLHKESKLPAGQKVPFVLVAQNGAREILDGAQNYLQQLSNAASVDFAEAAPDNALAAALPGVEIFLPLAGLVDSERESARLGKERDAALKDLERVNGKLNNENFTSRAPADIIAKEEAKRAELETAVRNLDARLAALG
jgi:valyl-tRNA synthetase